MFKNFFSKNPTSIIGVDIGPSSIKVVQLQRKKGKAVLETYGSLALGPYGGASVGQATHLAPEKIAEALNDLLREANVSSKAAGVSIPMSSSLVSIIEVPTSDPEQLQQMIPIEARKYIPVPVTEVVLDWSVIPRDETKISAFESASTSAPSLPGAGGFGAATMGGAGGTGMSGTFVPSTDPNAPIPRRVEMSEVLLVVIHNDALTHVQTVINTSGIDAGFFEIEIFSTMRSVLGQETAPVAILDVGASATKLYVIDRGILRASHVITRGSQDLTLALATTLSAGQDEAEVLKRTKGLAVGTENKEAVGVMVASLNHIFSETNRALANYEKRHGKKVEKLILTGGGSMLNGFLEASRAALQTSVSLADPFAKVEAPAFLAPVLKQVGPEFAVALGLALRRMQEMK